MKNKISSSGCEKTPLLFIKKFLIQAIISEQWLRFTYIQESEDGQFLIQITDETLHLFEKEYPQLYPLIQEFNGILIDANNTYEKIRTFCFKQFGIRVYTVINNPGFQEAIAHFQHWVQKNALFLEQNTFTFTDWIRLSIQNIPELQKVYN